MVLAGGRGRRLGGGRTEKPLVRVGGVPLLLRVLWALTPVPSLDVLVAVSPHTPRTGAFCRERGLPHILTPGHGLPADVGFLAERFPRFATVSADLPFLTSSTVGRFVRDVAHSPMGRVGLLPASRCRFPIPRDLAWHYGANGRGLGRLVGINWVVARARRPDRPYLFADPALEFNVNRPEDLRRARHRARTGAPGPTPRRGLG